MLSEHDSFLEKNLRGKWRNIRDYFMKELKLQKSQQTGPAGRKRKKYMYFDRLMFLMPMVENKRYINCRLHRSNRSARQMSHSFDRVFFQKFRHDDHSLQVGRERGRGRQPHDRGIRHASRTQRNFHRQQQGVSSAEHRVLQDVSALPEATLRDVVRTLGQRDTRHPLVAQQPARHSGRGRLRQDVPAVVVADNQTSAGGEEAGRQNTDATSPGDGSPSAG